MTHWPSPKHGYCQSTGCNYEGEIRINSDYQYLCPAHMNEYLMQARFRSATGKVSFIKSQIALHADALAKLEQELPEAVEAAADAKKEYDEARTWTKVAT
jgi:hypothetical protein